MMKFLLLFMIAVVPPTDAFQDDSSVLTMEKAVVAGTVTSSSDEEIGVSNCTLDSDLTDWIVCEDNFTIPGDGNSDSCPDEGVQANHTEDVKATRCDPVPPSRGPIWDQGTLSRTQYRTGIMVCEYMFTPLVILAVIFNIFNIIVYTDSSMRSPTSTYLIALSVNELIVAILSIIRIIMKLIYGVDAVKTQGYLVYILHFDAFFKSTVRRLMYCLTVLVSAERFLAVAFPLRARNFRLIKSPIVFIVSSSLICFVVHFPGALKWDVVQRSNTTEYELKPSKLYISTGEFLIILSLVNKIIFSYSVLILGLIMNLCVLVALKAHSKNRQKMKTTVDSEKAAKRERQTTIAILTSTFLFTVLALPLATDSIVAKISPIYGLYRKEHYLQLLMKEVNGSIILLSLSTDFIFYMLLSKAYRRTFFRRIPVMAAVFKRGKNIKETLQESDTKASTLSESVTDGP